MVTATKKKAKMAAAAKKVEAVKEELEKKTAKSAKAAKPAAVPAKKAATPTTVSAARQEALDGMTREARTIFLKEFEPLLLQAESEDLARRFQLGEICNRLNEDKELYGSNVIGQISQASGVEVSVLYGAISMYKVCEGSERTLQAYVKTARAHGSALTFTHFTEAARLPGVAARALIDKLTKKPVTTRVLREIVNKKLAKKKGDKAVEALNFTSAVSGTRKLVRSVGQAVDLLEGWETNLLVQFEEDELADEDNRQMLINAQEVLERTIAVSQEALQKVQDKLASVAAEDGEEEEEGEDTEEAEEAEAEEAEAEEGEEGDGETAASEFDEDAEEGEDDEDDDDLEPAEDDEDSDDDEEDYDE